MRGQIQIVVSTSLYNKIQEEKKKLQKAEDTKVKARKQRITLVIASRSISRRIK